MTVVQETFTTAKSQPAAGAVVFTPCAIRPDNDGNIVVPCPVRFQIVAGVLTTTDLEPGCYTVTIVLDCTKCPENGTYTITVPESGPADLMDLILTDLPLPADIAQYVVSWAGLSGVVTIQQVIAALAGVVPTVADSVVDGVVDVAPSQNAVFDALALKAPIPDAVRLERTTALSVPNLVVTALPWQVAAYDTTGSMFEPTGIRIPYAGIWRLTVDFVWDSDFSGGRIFQIGVNQANLIVYDSAAANSTGGGNIHAFSVYEGVFAAGDLIEVYVVQNAGSNQLILTPTELGTTPYFAASFVRALP